MRHPLVRRLPQLAAPLLAGLGASCAPDGGAAMGDLLARAPSSAVQAVHRVCPDGETVFGIDVSKYQGNIDWQAVADDGVKYAIIRTSDGLGFRDEKFEQNWAGAKAAGIVRGVYQFFRSDEDPVAQADFMLDMMGPLEPGDLPPTMDMESTDGVSNATRIARMHQWFDRVEASVGTKAFIYTGGYFWDSNVGTDEFNDHHLWHAGYTGGTCPSTVSDSWADWTFWQYSSAPSNGDGWRTVDGIAGGADPVNGSLDENRFNGTMEQLMALTVGDAVCGDQRCSPGEDHANCPGDCPVCESIPPTGDVIDDTDLCFTGGGPQQFLRRVSDAGEGGGLLWTHTTDQAAEDNFGEWTLSFVEAGRYRLEAFTAAAYAESTQARYRVRHAGVEDSFVVDQTAIDGWTLVAADVAFAAGGDQFVHLADNTGEPLSRNVQLVFDALRLTRLDAPTPGEGEGEGEAPAGEGEGEGEGEPAPGEGEGEGGGGPAAPRGAPERIVVQSLAPSVKDGCAATPAGTAPLALTLLLLGRRRRR
jgi:GH25 family lysozyme M1 (1,4-beta-N-acetylmuramidase)